MRDVMIVGGGIVGLWCAKHLRESGLDVTIVDKDDFSDGCSYGNAGMIVPSHFIPLASPGMIAKGMRWMFQTSSPFYIRPRLRVDLLQWLWLFYRNATTHHVESSVELLRDLHTESREQYRSLHQHPEFDFQFEQKGILMMYRSTHAERDELEMAEMAHTLGVEARHLNPWQLADLEPGIRMDVKGAVHYPGDAHLNPNLLMLQLKSYLERSGVSFLPFHEMTHLEDDGGLSAQVHFKNGSSQQARHIILATGSWSGRLMQQHKYRLLIQDGKGYSMTLKSPLIKPTIPSILHEARVAVTPMGDNLRISGTLEISGMDDIIRQPKVNGILEAMPAYYPDIQIADPGPVWYGYRPCTPDGLPYIGRLRKDSSVIAATGHAMMGLSLAPVTGRWVRDLIVDGKEMHPKLRPNRF